MVDFPCVRKIRLFSDFARIHCGDFKPQGMACGMIAIASNLLVSQNSQLPVRSKNQVVSIFAAVSANPLQWCCESHGGSL